MSRFSTDYLAGVVESTLRPPKALLDRYFRTEIQSEAEEISFDVVLGKRRVAPFVSPLVAGRVVQSQQREVRTFKPAYVKDKRRFDPTLPLKRAVGERIGGGEISPAERAELHAARELADQIDMLDRRGELMASELIRTGKVTVEGEGYPIQVVDFRRNAALSVDALAGDFRWGQVSAVPLKNLRTWATLGLKTGGAGLIDVIMGMDAFDAFMDDEAVQKEIDTRNITNATFAPTAQIAEGMQFQGTVRGFNIFSYGGWYVDPADDVEKEIFPANEVAMASQLLEGVRAYGAILDGKNGYRPASYFPKMWEEEDPAVEWLMLQSAPLTVATRPDATLGVQVMG